MPGGLERVADLDGDRFLEAVVTADGGGAHGNLEYYLCAFRPRFRLLACVRAGRSGMNEFTDLDRDGKKEIMLGDDSFANFDDLPCAKTPTLPMVLGCMDSRYVDVTARYPDIVHADIVEARSLLRQMIPSNRREPIEAYDTSARDSLAIDWPADAAIIGEEDEAYAEIAKLAPEDLRHWLSENQAKIISVMRTRSSKLSYRAPTLAGMAE